MNRRTWILSALGATGALVVGWGVLPPRSRLGSPDMMLSTEGDVALNGWIKIAADGMVILAMPRSEMGQGIHTVMAMMVAEELDVPLQRVRLEEAGAASIYGNTVIEAMLPFHPLESEGVDKPMRIKASEWLATKIVRELNLNMTGGSASVADTWEPLRLAAATARASLLGAAALAWKVPKAELSVQDGVVTHGSGQSARHAHYGEFAKAAAGVSPGDVRLKQRKDWKLLGQPAQRIDIPGKTNGSARFGLDVRLPDMLLAAVRLCPMLDGKVATLDAKDALALPGVQRLVSLDTMVGSTAGFAVVAKTTWHAFQGAQAVKVQWQQREQGALDTQHIEQALFAALKSDDSHVFYEKGDVDAAEKAAARMIKATYKAPYLAHATMEPMNCTAQFKDGHVEIWAPTQAPQASRAAAARVAGVSEEQVLLHVTLLGGGFGRRVDVDYVALAVRVAMECEGRPVQLTWSREQDMTHDFYRPMQVVELNAAMDANGAVRSLRIKSAGDAPAIRFLARTWPQLAPPIDMPDNENSTGLFDLPYGFEHQHMSHVATRMGVPVGPWRSVGHSHNAFFSECFVDELAAETGQDPLAFRLALLKAAPRYAAVLQLAADKANWGRNLPVGHAQGVALVPMFGTIVAEIAEVSIQDGQPRVHRVVCAVDCGTVVNPNTVAQQMEGSVVFALTAALYGRIDIKQSEVQQTNFHDYPMLKLAQAPVVETWIVPSTRAPTGMGEPRVPPLAPAVANALFRLTGKRQRSLPYVM